MTTEITWRDVADQLTPEQIAELDTRETPDHVTDREGWLLNLAREFASNNLGSLMFDTQPAGAVSCYEIDDDGGRWFECSQTEVGDTTVGIEGRQHADGHCEHWIALWVGGPVGNCQMPATQARELATVLFTLAEKLDAMS